MRIPCILIFCLLAAACGPGRPDLKGFEQVEGQWKNEQEKKVFTENWQVSAERMSGTGYLVNGTDTLFGEKLLVQNINGKLVYIADIPGQNPVLFTCTQQHGNTWRFENPEHDYPQVIVYTLKNDSSLVVMLQGKPGENPEEMIFKRIKP